MTCVVIVTLSSYTFPSEAPGTRTLPNIPANGASLEITPPGFTWWRAGHADSLTYVVRIFDGNGAEVMKSEPTDLCRWKPSKVLPAGSYSWVVDAIDGKGNTVCSRQKENFSILPGALEFPMPDIDKSLSRISGKHPRLNFDKKRINEIINAGETAYGNELNSLNRICARALTMEVFPEPEFNRMPKKSNSDFARMRATYKKEFGEYSKYAREYVLALGLKYLLTGDEDCGEAAKMHLLRMAELQIDNGGPIITHNGGLDEIALITADTVPWVYDWTYNLYSKEEREFIENFMVKLMNAFCHRLSPKGFDYLYKVSDSHSGRIPAYEITFSICLKERPEARIWLEQALQYALTNYPYWACEDGGWAEGVSYSCGYTTFLISSFESLRRQTGINLFQLPFMRNYPKFLYYTAVPRGENTPFGDEEENKTNWVSLGSIMHYISCATGDGELRWMAEKYMPGPSKTFVPTKNIQQNISFRDIKATKPDNVPNSKVFPIVGWAGLHSDVQNPAKDLAFIFKSSPFGSISHSHMDQNSFVILYGGTSLAIPAGARYPVASSPFHEEYTRTTKAHNTLLFGERGQVEKTQKYYGTIAGSEETEHLSYVCGQAATAYKGVRKFYRHCLMVRPGVIIVYDEYELENSEKVDWLFHAKEEMVLRGDNAFVSVHNGKSLEVELFGSQPFSISQTDEWPTNPKKGYEFYNRTEIRKQWHLDAAFEPAAEGNILAVMKVDPATECSCSKSGNAYEISIRFPKSKEVAVIRIDGSNVSASYGTESIKFDSKQNTIL